MEAGAEAGAESAQDGVHAFSDDEAWDVMEEIPNDSAAALILLEHHWAVPLRDAIVRAGDFRLSDGFISPLDLVEIGLVSAAEAEELHAMEQKRARRPSRSSAEATIGGHHDGIAQGRPPHQPPSGPQTLDTTSPADGHERSNLHPARPAGAWAWLGLRNRTGGR